MCIFGKYHFSALLRFISLLTPIAMRILTFTPTSLLATSLYKQALAMNTIFRHIEQVTPPWASLHAGTAAWEMEDLQETLRKSDVVFTLFTPREGPEGAQAALCYAQSVQTLIEAMQSRSQRRLIALADASILQYDDTMYTFEEPSFQKEQRAAAHNLSLVHRFLQASNLDWTLVCPFEISPKEGVTKNYRIRINYLPKEAKAIALDDLAYFLLKEARSQLFVRQRIGISL